MQRLVKEKQIKWALYFQNACVPKGGVRILNRPNSREEWFFRTRIVNNSFGPGHATEQPPDGVS